PGRIRPARARIRTYHHGDHDQFRRYVCHAAPGRKSLMPLTNDDAAPKIVQPSTTADDRVMLEGPHSRSREMWLIYRVVKDFVQAFRVMHFVGPCVTVFGSARVHEDHPYYH